MKPQDGKVLLHRESENGHVRFLECRFQLDRIAHCVFQDQVLTGRLFFSVYNTVDFFVSF
jgi:hypothetical protein